VALSGAENPAVKLAILSLATLLACAPSMQVPGTEPAVTERLYFGRNIGDTLGVTDSAWTVFVTEVVSARLPRGFTLWKAEGQWRGTDGRPRRESTFVLEVVHSERSADTEVAILAIITEYKRRFSQQAVLRVITVGRATY
jgi:hypothetical protein